MNHHTNIILINIDDMGYGDLSCYGSTINHTPTIDKLAEEGMLFTDFYAAAPVCTPSRAGMLTGCYPQRIDFLNFGVYDHKTKERNGDFGVLMPGQPEGLNPNEKTLASLLKEKNYSTKLVGKWHVGDQEDFSPLNFGFDSFLGLPYSNDLGLQTPKTVGLKRMSYTLCPLPLIKDDRIIAEQPDQKGITELYTYEAIDFIKENKSNPFFLYLSHMYVHNPLFVSKRFMDTSSNGEYGAALAEIDWSLSAIQYELKQLNLEDNTLIILTSDNGGAGATKRASNLPLRGHKGLKWEGGSRVSCIMKWPEKIKAGSICNKVVSMLDFYPTFAEIAGIKINDNVIRDGHSFLELLDDPINNPSKYDYFCFYTSGSKLCAIRSGDYKLHLDSGELYDLKNDIAESEDISNNPENSKIIDKILAYAEEVREDLGDSLTGAIGKNCRPKGFVENFKPMTYYDKNKPYIIALYDVDD